MSVRARLYLLCAVLIAVLITPAISALRHLNELRNIAVDLHERDVAALLATARLQSSLAELRMQQHVFVVDGNPEVRDEVSQLLRSSQDYVAQLGETGFGQASQSLGRQLDHIVDVSARVDSLVEAGAIEEAGEVLGSVEPRYQQLQGSLETLSVQIDELGSEVANRARDITETGIRTVELGTGVAGGLAMLLAVIAISAVVAPIQRLRNAMSDVAGGRFLPPDDLPYDQRDEIGDLSRSFRSMTDRLGELDRVKAEFVGIASHELKTPVNVIRGYAEMMEDGYCGPVSEKQQAALTQIREQTDHLAERVNQLLSVSRMEAKGIEMETREVPLVEVLGAIRAAYAPVAARREISLRVESDASAPDAVTLDTDRIQNELFGNLLSNAFKFTQAGGEVTLSASGAGDNVVFELRDTGEGIPRSELPFIFEKYYQAGSHAGKVGAGLGLAIAREIVEAHGGTIGADSTPGRGTTFHIELPAANGRD